MWELLGRQEGLADQYPDVGGANYRSDREGLREGSEDHSRADSGMDSRTPNNQRVASALPFRRSPFLLFVQPNSFWGEVFLADSPLNCQERFFAGPRRCPISMIQQIYPGRSQRHQISSSQRSSFWGGLKDTLPLCING